MTSTPQWNIQMGQRNVIGGYAYSPQENQSMKDSVLAPLIKTAEMHLAEEESQIPTKLPAVPVDQSKTLQKQPNSIFSASPVAQVQSGSVRSPDLVVYEEARGLTRHQDVDNYIEFPPTGLIDMHITEQPPAEVRTRTPSENRMFSCRVVLTGPYMKFGIAFVKCSIVYRSGTDHAPVFNQAILGGKKLVRIVDNQAIFSNLSISEASTKHKENEFCLEFVPVCRNPETGQLMETTVARFSNPFYAYSHKKVLLRRKLVQLRAISKPYGVFAGGETMHVVGSPFISGPSLAVVLRTPHGDVAATDLEVYMNAVLFFKLPPYPHPNPPATQIRSILQVTNDGRSFSYPIDFLYYHPKPGQAVF